MRTFFVDRENTKTVVFGPNSLPVNILTAQNAAPLSEV